jgi:hypothetical protein
LRNGITGNLDGTPIFNLLDFRPLGVQGVGQNLTEQGNTGNRLAGFLSNEPDSRVGYMKSDIIESG